MGNALVWETEAAKHEYEWEIKENTAVLLCQWTTHKLDSFLGTGLETDHYSYLHHPVLRHNELQAESWKMDF